MPGALLRAAGVEVAKFRKDEGAIARGRCGARGSPLDREGAGWRRNGYRGAVEGGLGWEERYEFSEYLLVAEGVGVNQMQRAISGAGELK